MVILWLVPSCFGPLVLSSPDPDLGRPQAESRSRSGDFQSDPRAWQQIPPRHRPERIRAELERLPLNPRPGGGCRRILERWSVARSMTWKLADVMTDCVSANTSVGPLLMAGIAQAFVPRLEIFLPSGREHRNRFQSVILIGLNEPVQARPSSPVSKMELTVDWHVRRRAKLGGTASRDAYVTGLKMGLGFATGIG